MSLKAEERVVEATSACSCFSWSAIEGASAYRRARFETRLDGNVEPKFTQRIGGAAFSWAPPAPRGRALSRLAA